MPRRALLLACLIVLSACRREPEAPASTPAATPPSTPAPVAEAAPAPALSGAQAMEEVKTSMDRFLAATSFHAVMTVEGSQPMQNEMDFVAPDRYRMSMPVGTQVIVGDTMYMELHGQRTQVPIPDGMISQWRDPMQLEKNRAGLEVEFLGDEAVGPAQARKYRVRHTKPEPGEFLYWIDAAGLPLQLRSSGESQNGPYTMTLQYSRFNDPAITIAPP